jgi:hypothetical protein
MRVVAATFRMTRRKVVLLALSGVILIFPLIVLMPRRFESSSLSWHQMYQGGDNDLLILGETRRGWNSWHLQDNISLARSDRTGEFRLSLIKLSGPSWEKSELLPGTVGPVPVKEASAREIAGWEPWGMLVIKTHAGSNTLCYWPRGSVADAPARELTVEAMLAQSRSKRFCLVRRDSEITVWDCKEWKSIASPAGRRTMTKLLDYWNETCVCDDGVHVLKLYSQNGGWKAEAIRIDTADVREFNSKLDPVVHCWTRDAEMVDGGLQFFRVISRGQGQFPHFDVVDATGTVLYDVPDGLIDEQPYFWNPARGVIIATHPADSHSGRLAVFDGRTKKIAHITPQLPPGWK